jgi:class 3 adenylate cyclase/tetratricopeptide (TPR) repeat protein
MICPSCGRPNPSDTEYCLRCGAPLRSAFIQERRWVSVVFFDLSRFTEFTLTHPLEDTWRAVHAALYEAGELVRKFGGAVDKFFGDGLLAVFGLYRSGGSDAAAALEAAQAMVQRAQFPARAGVASGLVLKTPLGGGVAGDQTVIGPAVNLAQRLSQAAHPGQVWMDSSTFHLAPWVQARSLPLVELKGFPEPLTPLVYEGPGAGELPLIDREEQLARLEENLARVRAGEGRRVFLEGPMGSGKTRLIQAFFQRLPQGTWGGIAPSLTRGVPLRYTLRQGFEALFPFDLEQWIAARPLPEPLLSALRYSLGLQSLIEEQRLELLLVEAWREVLARIARKALVVLCLEDLPSADPTVIEFARRPLKGPFLLLLSGRHNPLAPADDLEVIQVGPLGLEESWRLLGQLVPRLEPRRAQALVALSGGFPLALRSLALDPEGEPEPLPFYQSRLDTLPRLLRMALQAAAVLGDGATLPLIRHLAGEEAELGRLFTEGFLELSEGGQVEFRVPLLREALLAQLDEQQARSWHQEAAIWYQAQNQLGEAARHLEAAGELMGAFRTWRLHAQKLWVSQAYEQALAAYREALRLAEGGAWAQVALEFMERLLALGRFNKVLEFAQHPRATALFRLPQAEAYLELGQSKQAAGLLQGLFEPRAEVLRSYLEGFLPPVEELPPQHEPLARLLRARLLERWGHLPEAWRELELDREHAPYWMTLARLLKARLLRELEGPSPALELLTEPPPEILPPWVHSLWHAQQAQLLIDLGRLSEAGELLREPLWREVPPPFQRDILAPWIRLELLKGELPELLAVAQEAPCGPELPEWILVRVMDPQTSSEQLYQEAQRLRSPFHPEAWVMADLALGLDRLWNHQDPRWLLKEALALNRLPMRRFPILFSLAAFQMIHAPSRGEILLDRLEQMTERRGLHLYAQFLQLLRGLSGQPVELPSLPLVDLLRGCAPEGQFGRLGNWWLEVWPSGSKASAR